MLFYDGFELFLLFMTNFYEFRLFNDFDEIEGGCYSDGQRDIGDKFVLKQFVGHG